MYNNWFVLKANSNQAIRSEGTDEGASVKPDIPGLSEEAVKAEDRVLRYIRNLRGKENRTSCYCTLKEYNNIHVIIKVAVYKPQEKCASVCVCVGGWVDGCMRACV